MPLQSIELLAPAKNADTGIEAIRHGADAVYIGGPGFGARAAAGNSVEDIERLCQYAHLFGARVYVTLNTILYDDELAEVERLVRQLYDVGVDALIVQDMALLSLRLPPIALHASTQMDNCTPERAALLEKAGYSQIVVARELSLQQIRDIHAATSLPIEAFVHGALCVSYSGRCYASEYCFGRSANRGRCAQFCRLAFSLVDADGRVVEAALEGAGKAAMAKIEQLHLLSLRDMNRSAYIEEMLDAGVRSFKIEGRLKDAAYVKNVTAYYRRAIDAVLARRSEEFVRASAGTTTVHFTPQLSKSFNRGFTSYFLNGRTPDVWNFHTPKSMGEPVGRVERVGARSFVVLLHDGVAPLHNGDGLCFLGREGLTGFRANRVEMEAGRRAEVFPLRMPEVRQGDAVYRNEDHQWESLLARPTAERRLPLAFRLEEVSGGYRLTASASGVQSSVEIPTEHQAAAKPQSENLHRQLGKLGDTPFVLESVSVETDGERFIPASLVAAARRDVVALLQQALCRRHLQQRDVRRPMQRIDLHGASFGYQANVANAVSRRWLLQHGAADVAPAFEIRQPRQAVVMTCRHCLRYAFGQCPRQTHRPPTWKEPLALRLPDGRSFPLVFDCQHCEMQVLAPRS